MGALLAWVYMQKGVRKWKQEVYRVEKEKEREEKKFSELEGYDEKKQELDKEWKQKIMDKIREEGSVRNRNIADMLEVSSRMALCYLSELEGEDRIKQTEPSGRDVRYELAE